MKIILVLSLAATGLAAAASAQTPPAPIHGAATAAMTRTDVVARIDARFARLDTNHDGILTGDERRAGIAMRRRRAQADRRLTAAEYRDHALQRFDHADTNHDGRIDPAERQVERDAMRGRAGRDAPPPPAR